MLGVTYTGGHSIPYQLTYDEMIDFLSRNVTNAALQSYLASCDPPWGLVIQEAYGEMLVWHDQSHSCSDMDGLHVVDITNMGISQQINQAPFESPDSSFVQNLINQIKAAVAAATPTINLGLVAVIAVAALLIVRETR